MITGLRPETFKSLQLNAGVFLRNFNYSTIENVDALEDAIIAALEAGGDKILGATIGGGSFQMTPSVRNIEADGMRYPIKGSTVNDMWTVKLTSTMKECRPQNFKDALICADMTTNEAGNITTIKVRTDIEMSDYIPSLCWVGDTSRGFVMIDILNALNLTGANFTFTDKGEGSLPFEFQAHAADLKSMKYAPVNIVFFDALEEAEAADQAEGEAAEQAEGEPAAQAEGEPAEQE